MTSQVLNQILFTLNICLILIRISIISFSILQSRLESLLETAKNDDPGIETLFHAFSKISTITKHLYCSSNQLISIDKYLSFLEYFDV